MAETEMQFPTRRRAQVWLRGQGYIPCKPDPVSGKIRAYWKMGSFAHLERAGRTFNGETRVILEAL